MSYINTFNQSLVVDTFNTRNVSVSGIEFTNNINFTAGVGITAWIGAGRTSNYNESDFYPAFAEAVPDRVIPVGTGSSSELRWDPSFYYDYTTNTVNIPTLNNVNLISNLVYGGGKYTIGFSTTLDLTTSQVGKFKASGVTIQTPVRTVGILSAREALGNVVNRTTFANYGTANQTVMNFDIPGGGAYWIENTTQLEINPSSISRITNNGTITRTYIVSYQIVWDDLGAKWDNYGGIGNVASNTFNGDGYSGRRSAVFVKNGDWTNGLHGMNVCKWSDPRNNGELDTRFTGTFSITLAPLDYMECYLNYSATERNQIYPGIVLNILEI